jgi:hypothetical protein
VRQIERAYSATSAAISCRFAKFTVHLLFAFSQEFALNILRNEDFPQFIDSSTFQHLEEAKRGKWLYCHCFGFRFFLLFIFASILYLLSLLAAHFHNYVRFAHGDYCGT